MKINHLKAHEVYEVDFYGFYINGKPTVMNDRRDVTLYGENVEVNIIDTEYPGINKPIKIGFIKYSAV